MRCVMCAAIVSLPHISGAAIYREQSKFLM